MPSRLHSVSSFCRLRKHLARCLLFLRQMRAEMSLLFKQVYLTDDASQRAPVNIVKRTKKLWMVLARFRAAVACTGVEPRDSCARASRTPCPHLGKARARNEAVLHSPICDAHRSLQAKARA